MLLIHIAVVMFRKGLQKDFPVFFTYVLFEILEFGVLFTMLEMKVPGPTQMSVDRLSRGGDVALHFGIIQELFESPFANIVPMRRAMGRIFGGLSLVLILLAMTFIAPLYYRFPGYGLLKGYVGLEALNTAQCALLVCVFIWHQFLGFRMSPCVFGIALGVGLVVSSDPLILALKNWVPTQNSPFVDLTQMAIFQGVVLLWIYYVRARETVNTNIDAAYLLEARDWASGVERITRP
ncbi:MAG: hypothetical protein WA172_19485 [Terriglobales bacterium]